jgi:hypothetical protein
MFTDFLSTISLVAYVSVWVIFIICLADLICGLVHWFEDSYGNEDWPVIGSAIIAPNRLHHDKPRAFLDNSWWESARVQMVAAAVVLSLAFWVGLFSWQLALLVILAVNGNEIHKYAHRSRDENNHLITWLQDKGLIQGLRHHAHHHRGLRNSHYCPMTQWVNPVVDRLHLWRFLELCILKTMGIKPWDEFATQHNLRQLRRV